jgi:hypothetical protein
MRAAIVIVAACGSTTAPPLKATPAVAVADAAVTPSSPQCPIVVRDAPNVSWYDSLHDASAHLPTITNRDEPAIDLAELAKHGNAFALERPEGYLHESDERRSFIDAVFVQPKRVTLVKRLFDRINSIPSECGEPLDSDVLAVKIVTPHVGQIRLRRHADSLDVTTFAAPGAQARNARCTCAARFEVDDMFIDLDRGEALRTYAQVYATYCYNPGVPTLVPFDAYVVTGDGVTIASPACSYFWDQ